ncbi:hypothetical protein CHS0354_008401, partial [Potamilus streckersoni]
KELSSLYITAEVYVRLTTRKRHDEVPMTAIEENDDATTYLEEKDITIKQAKDNITALI